MKPSTYRPVSKASSATTAHKRASSSTTSSVQTITIDAHTSAILITVETTAARLTLDGSDPSASSAPSMVVQSAQNPLFVPVGSDTVIKFVSTAAAAAIVQVCELS